MNYKIMAGTDIKQATIEMVELADSHNESVQSDFNGVILTANPGDIPAAIVAYYEQSIKKPACISDDAIRFEQEQRNREIRLHDALLASVPALTLHDADEWQNAVDANTDDYGSAVLRFAERWGRLMEGKMLHGEDMATCADDCATLADVEGISGFMYGCAVGLLSKTWVHGEMLRQWHNLKTQIGHEGEKANANGGVLNPALLKIG